MHVCERARAQKGRRAARCPTSERMRMCVASARARAQACVLEETGRAEYLVRQMRLQHRSVRLAAPSPALPDRCLAAAECACRATTGLPWEAAAKCTKQAFNLGVIRNRATQNLGWGRVRACVRAVCACVCVCVCLGGSGLGGGRCGEGVRRGGCGLARPCQY